jgi:hypothetical protein
LPSPIAGTRRRFLHRLILASADALTPTLASPFSHRYCVGDRALAGGSEVGKARHGHISVLNPLDVVARARRCKGMLIGRVALGRAAADLVQGGFLCASTGLDLE